MLLQQAYDTFDERLMPIMLALRDQIAAENAALGAVVFHPADLLWPEVVGVTGLGDSLLEHRRRLLQRAGWL